MPWGVLDEYNIGHMSYELSKLGASLVQKILMKNIELSKLTIEKPRFCVASIGPGTKLPSLGSHQIWWDVWGCKIMAKGLVDGGTDIFYLKLVKTHFK